MTTPRWVNPETAGEMAQVSERVIKGWLKKGLPHARVTNKLIRINPTDLDEFMAKHLVIQGEPSQQNGGLREDEKKRIDRIVNGLLP